MPVGARDIPEYGGRQSRASIERYIEIWRPLLGMQTWKVKVAWDKPIKGKYNAEIYVSDKLRSGVMSLHPTFTKWSDYWAETTIIHEMLHCLCRATDTVWDNLHCEASIGLDALPLKMYEREYVTENERFIDQLSCRLYDLRHSARA